MQQRANRRRKGSLPPLAVLKRKAKVKIHARLLNTVDALHGDWRKNYRSNARRAG
ncbi:hypothetical protein HMPREF1868_00460 [Olsenella sp. DNF00959]|nr:hypothetical protein HMPREF1868_00460 [Olsenella sp. DNF00959]